MTRRNAREIVMQMLYEGNFHDETERERIIYDTIKEMDQEEKKNNKAVISFMESLYFGVYEHLNEIDVVIEKHATNWSFSRIAKVDLSILRLAIYELKYTDVPQKVAVNEAVEIAKIFSTEKSPKFINGILGSVIKETEV
ncbi:MAG: transcription antitermination factor NusB [Cellulosilyticum sp.]|nr:transcription antitermination factor NusB [Cellulosilyticum sp.]